MPAQICFPLALFCTRWRPEFCRSGRKFRCDLKGILDGTPTPAVRLNPDIPANWNGSLTSVWRKTGICVTSTPLIFVPICNG